MPALRRWQGSVLPRRRITATRTRAGFCPGLVFFDKPCSLRKGGWPSNRIRNRPPTFHREAGAQAVCFWYSVFRLVEPGTTRSGLIRRPARRGQPLSRRKGGSAVAPAGASACGGGVRRTPRPFVPKESCNVPANGTLLCDDDFAL